MLFLYFLKYMLIFSEEPVFISNLEETKIYKPCQRFSFVCPNCGKLETKKLFKKAFLCRKCCTDQEEKSRKIKESKKKLNMQEVNEKRKQTCLQKYGVDNIRKSEQYKNYCKRLHIQNYGVENVSQAQEIKNKKEQTCLKHFNSTNPLKSEKIKEKVRQTNLQKYGVANPIQTLENKRKRIIKRKKWLETGGLEKMKQLWTKSKRKALSEKVSKTWSQKTPEEIREIRKKASIKYIYQNITFDSSWELAFYIYYKDQNANISRETKTFEYFVDNKRYIYIPDFEVDEKLYEIKGNQFLAEDGSWKDPYKTQKTKILEAKHQCALKNNVTILYFTEIKKYLNYVESKYGKDYLQKFRLNNFRA